MSPVSFGPSDVNNPHNLQWAHVPESFWMTKALVFDFEWVLEDSKISTYNRKDYPEDTPHAALKHCFRTLRTYEIRLGLTSNRRQKQVVPELAYLNLTEDFDNIRCFEDVKKVKPDPELLLFSLETLGVKPVRAVAFETTAEGVQAAKAAGVFCVGLPHLKNQADLVLHSFIEEPILQVLERIDKEKRSRFNY